jgi:hypothetical protein
MFDTYKPTGYDLYQPFDSVDQWVIDINCCESYHGTFKQVVEFMIKKLDFYLTDIESALDLFLGDSERFTGSNCIHFGINKTAIFICNYKEFYGKRAS